MSSHTAGSGWLDGWLQVTPTNLLGKTNGVCSHIRMPACVLWTRTHMFHLLCHFPVSTDLHIVNLPAKRGV